MGAKSSRRRQGRAAAYALAGALALFGGCSQSEGQRCEIDSDCAGGLYCAATGSPHNGVCRPKTGTSAGGSTGQTSIPDATVNPEVDAGLDPDAPAGAAAEADASADLRSLAGDAGGETRSAE